VLLDTFSIDDIMKESYKIMTSKSRIALFTLQSLLVQLKTWNIINKSAVFTYFVSGNLLFNFVDEFAGMTKARKRSFRVAKPLHVFVKRCVKAKHIAQMFLKVTLQTHQSTYSSYKEISNHDDDDDDNHHHQINCPKYNINNE